MAVSSRLAIFQICLFLGRRCAESGVLGRLNETWYHEFVQDSMKQFYGNYTQVQAIHVSESACVLSPHACMYL
jgi:hypothetical protein